MYSKKQLSRNLYFQKLDATKYKHCDNNKYIVLIIILNTIMTVLYMLNVLILI